MSHVFIINGKRFLNNIFFTILIFITTIVIVILYRETNYYPPIAELSITKSDLISSILGRYYIDFSQSKYIDKANNLDRNGIPTYIADGVEDNHHPVYISQFALGAYDYYISSKDLNARNSFLKCASWLKDNMRRHGNFYFWEYIREYPGYAALVKNVPWFSAMAQGEGASVLLRAFIDTADRPYYKLRKMQPQGIFYDLSSGGISIVRGNGYILPQEYPTDTASNVLNGAIFAYWGVYDYYRVTRDPEIKKKNDVIIKTLSNALEHYDTGYWSLYSLWPADNLADYYYHSVHIAQLKILYLISDDKNFLRYAQKFEYYHNNLLDRTQYVFANHLRQIRKLTLSDIKRMPKWVGRILSS